MSCTTRCISPLENRGEFWICHAVSVDFGGAEAVVVQYVAELLRGLDKRQKKHRFPLLADRLVYPFEEDRIIKNIKDRIDIFENPMISLDAQAKYASTMKDLD